MNIYCDMDGVLANFSKEPNAVERFAMEGGFFAKLEPIRNNVVMLRELIEMGHNVFILSASPNERADNDKREWLNHYLPNVQKENIIIMRNGQNKADFVRTLNDNVLLDDYGKNCRDFQNRGYMSLKIDKYNSIRRCWNKYQKDGRPD